MSREARERVRAFIAGWTRLHRGDDVIYTVVPVTGRVDLLMSDLSELVEPRGTSLAREMEAISAGTHEPAVDDFGNQYLSPVR